MRRLAQAANVRDYDAGMRLGNGVAFAVAVQSARLAGSTGLVRGRHAVVSAWADGLIKQITNYPYSDRNEGRADAERLAEARG
jgi:hypothetical protein